MYRSQTVAVVFSSHCPTLAKTEINKNLLNLKMISDPVTLTKLFLLFFLLHISQTIGIGALK
jgi:hypothetical protein